MASDGGAPSDRLRERAEGGRLRLWLLLEADRWLVTGLLVAGVFVTLVAAGYLYPTAENAIRTSDSVDTLFQGLLTATITGVTLVLTLNQVVLSQELGAVKDQRERMDGAMAFREDVADVIRASVSPSRPAQFLRALVQVSGEQAQDLRGTVPDSAGRTSGPTSTSSPRAWSRTPSGSPAGSTTPGSASSTSSRRRSTSTTPGRSSRPGASADSTARTSATTAGTRPTT